MLLLLVLLLPMSYRSASIPCTNINPAGCLLVDTNQNDTFSTTCQCKTCQVGLAVASNGINCCLASVANCYKCSSAYTCITCNGYYGFNSSSVCVECKLFITNCLYCSTISGGCTTCLS